MNDEGKVMAVVRECLGQGAPGVFWPQSGPGWRRVGGRCSPPWVLA